MSRTEYKQSGHVAASRPSSPCAGNLSSRFVHRADSTSTAARVTSTTIKVVEKNPAYCVTWSCHGPRTSRCREGCGVTSVVSVPRCFSTNWHSEPRARGSPFDQSTRAVTATPQLRNPLTLTLAVLGSDGAAGANFLYCDESFLPQPLLHGHRLNTPRSTAVGFNDASARRLCSFAARNAAAVVEPPMPWEPIKWQGKHRHLVGKSSQWAKGPWPRAPGPCSC